MPKQKKILLHTCCAPCLIYPAGKLIKDGFEVTGFFYNPNIHPQEEYQNRRKAVEDLSGKDNIKVIYPEYSDSQFFAALNENKEAPERCSLCWGLRLKETACEAKKNGCNFFTTTLLVSPYQDQEILRKIGVDTAREEGVEFYYEDFRPGFRTAHNEARAKGIYCQKYCGCVYSEKERHEKLPR